MEYNILSLIFAVLICAPLRASSDSDSNSFVVSSTEPTKEGDGSAGEVSPLNPQIYSMQIQANVSNRFARTLITSKVRNPKKSAAETTFSVVLPENAFISEFEMEIKGKIYKAYVKEKEEAKQIYEQAVASGQSAAHVSARDSKTFTVSVNVEPESKTEFRLVYEELLQRQLGQYELVINIHPGQVVKDLGVQVHINETRPLTFVRTPSLRTGNEISKNADKLSPSADIKQLSNTSATVRFSPDVDQQKSFAQLLGNDKENGLAGQFVVQYDVERDPQGGEVLVRDGYFVHFFAPTDLQPLLKHAVFVLDHSGSMDGRKIEQLVEAMQNILSELKTDDLFNMVRFSDHASVWDIETDKFEPVSVDTVNSQHEPQSNNLSFPAAVQATSENVKKAKSVITDTSNLGLTNIIDGLKASLFLIKRTQEKTPNKYQPMIIFLTDGLPNVGESSGDRITQIVTELNSGGSRAAIFSLSFGIGADKDFLQKLSSQNLGFSRHIYEAGDASLQLQDFYKQISSPLLSNITFKYVDGVTDVTKTKYPILFNGSELVVAGKIHDQSNVLLNVGGICTTGPVTFNATSTRPVTPLERLWAYLTVQQILKEREAAANKTELTKKALDLALKYEFVTSVSSLVVVKPNETAPVDSVKVETLVPEHDIANRLPAQLGSASGANYFASSSFGSYAPQAAIPIHALGIAGPSGIPNYYNPPPPAPLPIQPPHYPAYTTTRKPPVPPSSSSTTAPQSSAPYIPLWLEVLKASGDNITTSQGTFELGASGDVTTYPDCPETPLNGTGFCTIIYDCPEVLHTLTDVNVYLKYFCPLNQYAGVCCPSKPTST